MNPGSVHEWHSFEVNRSASICLPSWRFYCDWLHIKLIREWTMDRRYERALKTDLFDESVGTGCIETLSKISDQVDGFDISSKIAAIARAKNTSARITVGDTRAMPYKSGTFDFVLSNSTLDHFEAKEDISASLREIARVSKSGGQAIITLDNPVNPVVFVRNSLPQSTLLRTGLSPYFMGQTLRMKNLCKLAESVGLRVVKRRHIQHVPRAALLNLYQLFAGKQGVSEQIVRASLAWEHLADSVLAPMTGYYSAILTTKQKI